MGAPKEIRFKKLVSESGQPAVVTIWGDPKKDKAFMRMVKAGRILTLVQKPTGNKKDFGLIGFHPQPFATYLTFPKPLKSNDDAIVTGIKYEMISREEGKVMGAQVRINASQPARLAPVRKLFEVTIQRHASAKVKMNVEALNSTDAKSRALADVKSQGFSLTPEEIENKVISVRES